MFAWEATATERVKNIQIWGRPESGASFLHLPRQGASTEWRIRCGIARYYIGGGGGSPPPPDHPMCIVLRPPWRPDLAQPTSLRRPLEGCDQDADKYASAISEGRKGWLNTRFANRWLAGCHLVLVELSH